MKKILTMIACGLTLAACNAQSTTDGGEARIQFPAEGAPKEIIVSSALLKDMQTARTQADLKIVYDTVPVNGGVATFTLSRPGAARYSIEAGPQQNAEFYALPGENILLQVSSMNPFNYTVEGTDLMHGITEFSDQYETLANEYNELMSGGNATEAQLQALADRYDRMVKDYVAAHPKSTVVPYLILNLSGQDFIDAYNGLTPEAKESMFMPFVEMQLDAVKGQIEAEKLHDALLSGDAMAPDFSFKNLKGEMVSLSDFRGKWVVIDFWGAWCGWCIKGFPALKEAYAKYKGKLEVLGVDCNDTPEAWREAVAKYELPWVNIYNDQKDGALLQQYGIQGFPTKAIVNPEGKLVDLTTGEDPSFYTRLADFLK